MRGFRGQSVWTSRGPRISYPSFFCSVCNSNGVTSEEQAVATRVCQLMVVNIYSIRTISSTQGITTNECTRHPRREFWRFLLATRGAETHRGLEAVIDPPLEA